ncbi:Peroxisomal membrane protein 11A [Ananas comosus]|uniref:Peroxisomal membrane protein 11A n=1 Tax=Ananas comosus TaxID=4615 RepID=A0A199W489_ANACO|nr:Peroxisomal membrane protein 11A [Ananas comosus]
MADQSQSSPNPKPLPPPPPPPRAAAAAAERDFLLHLEAYLARRDGVDKLLKIARYAAKIALSSPSGAGTLAPRLKAFESSVGLSRKAFRLGKFVQDVNALRCPSAAAPSAADRLLAAAAYGGEGLYYFVEQFVWLAKAGLIPAELAPRLQRISAWAELVGYAGSIALKLKEVKKIRSTIESKTPISKSGKCDGIEERRRRR